MAILTKNGGTKILSNEGLIGKLLSDGWVLVKEIVEISAEIKEVKNGKSSKSHS